MNWTYVMERWCGLLVPAVKSRVSPYKSITRRQFAIAQENTILARYNLYDTIRGPSIDPDDPRLHEEIYDEGIYLIQFQRWT